MSDADSYSIRYRNSPDGSKSASALVNSDERVRSSPPCLITWNELEEWQKDNEYIVGGYRRVRHNWMACIESVYAYLHNETINIHSHLWAAILVAYLCTTFYGNHIKPFAPVSTWVDSAVFLTFLISAIACLSLSASFHAFGCHSEKVASRCHAYDYSGIIILIVGSFVPAIYYGFFCDNFHKYLYLTIIFLGGLGAAYIVLSPEYSKPTHRGARTAVFIALGVSAVVPVSHLIASLGLHELVINMGLGWLLVMGALYIIGALLYANRIPERFAPGRFDYFFASHQIFHVCVVLAILAHYRCVIIVSAYRFSASGACGT
ncbi:hypothetical protein AGABI1DRAFT_115647 [Agaricus bisporus var. burnettii JB137-S8]|uniref:HlyIII-domain-containing protein n=1 Tax=Agaricus bisporus var. burnettii (strain JB137-S8 / ATCC MYA-4627 / FGSC 10392) TaxID=597362 RepID=K5XPV8_AGABU|nr:uncharacterized protein AGABI1DRAFT_115647 [Agaricus bisporus var. burnettii JB137-S8]EKM76775.1 hypothetical protein AGABI1DRAFT_115647 [Agaricus bisporus var. burnettii JB137-S8]